MMKKLLVSFVVAVAVSMTACSIEIGNIDKTGELLNDPVITANFEGLQLISQYTGTNKYEDTVNVTRCLGFNNDVDGKQLMKTAINYGQSNGWDYPDSGVLDTKTSMIAFKENSPEEQMKMIVAIDGSGCGNDLETSGFDNIMRISISR